MKVKKEMLLMDYLLLSYNRNYLLHENDQVEIKKENTS